MRNSSLIRFSHWVSLALLTLAAFGHVQAEEKQTDPYSELRYRHIGPVGNRVSSVAGVAGDRQTYYAGAATGGVWKTADGGLTWAPVFDAQPVHAIGSLAVAPSDPNVVYAGTGETFIRSNVSIGNGVYKSTDGGKNWQHMGLDKTGRIGRVVVHPGNPDVVYAASMGHAYAPQQERGIYRSKDGGKTWERVLFIDENTGASDLAMDPNNPRILLAGTWQLDIKTWGRQSGGPGSGLHLSRDGGDTWKKLEGNGLPKPPLGKVAVCMTPEDSNRMYALIETGDGVPWNGQETSTGELWRSDDGGASWKLVNHDRDLAGRTAYYSRCAVSPDDADEAYFLAASYNITKDGGATSDTPPFGSAPGWDHHDMWIDPGDGNRMIVGHDGGVSISENRGKTWNRVQLPVAQMYHVTVDNQIPYYVYGNRQDGPSMRGPSNSRMGGDFGPGGIPRGMWHAVGGGESGFATPDPVDPNIIWSSTSGYGPVGGIVARYNEKLRQYRQVEVWPEATIGWPAEELKYRFQWTFPLLISPHDHNTVYVTSQVVHRTQNGGQSWEVISPDLTTNDKSKQKISGGLTPDNIGVEYCCVIYAFDESPVQQGLFWAGTNDGLVQISRDGGANWTNVTGNIPGLPELGVVRNIDASKWAAGKAYLTVDLHQLGNFAPYVYKTEDFGASWTKITEGIADSPLSYARNIREDPARPGLLYLGTENALYVSFDDGAHWRSLQSNLPHTPMYWIAIQEHFNDLVVGTYGRGFWILDDVTPLQQWTAEAEAADVHLFEPRRAYRFQPITEPMFTFGDPSHGDNPPYGASLHYWLKEDVEGDVVIKISDASGKLVRTLKEQKKEKGLHRVWWDLRGEKIDEIKLRTAPQHADWVELGKEGWRSGFDRGSILVVPGTYTVTLQVGDRELTQTLEVVKDPNTEGSLEDVHAQTDLLQALIKDFNSAAATINQIEWIRRQIYDLNAILKDRKDAEDVVTAGKALDEKLIAVEGKLIQLKRTGTGQDDIRWPAMLVEKLGYLGSSIAVGDYPPTDEHRQVQQLLRERLTEARSEVDQILATEVAAFKTTLSEKGFSAVITEFPE